MDVEHVLLSRERLRCCAWLASGRYFVFDGQIKRRADLGIPNFCYRTLLGVTASEGPARRLIGWRDTRAIHDPGSSPEIG